MNVKMKPVCDCGYIFDKFDIVLTNEDVCDFSSCYHPIRFCKVRSNYIINPSVCPKCGRLISGLAFTTFQDDEFHYDVNNYKGVD